MPAPSPPRGPRAAGNRWFVLALLVAARTAMSVQFYALPPLMPVLVAALGLDYARAGTLMGLFMLPGIVLALPGGMLGNRLGDKAMVLGGLALLAAGSLAFALGGSFGTLVVARISAGVGGVLLTVQLTKILADWFAGRELATAMAAMLASWPLGSALAVSTVGAAAEAGAWRGAMAGIAGVTLALLAAVAWRYRPALAPAGAPNRVSPLWRIGRSELALLLAASGVWFCFNGAVVLFYSFAPSLLVERGASLGRAGLLVSVSAWVATAWAPLAGALTDRVGRHNPIIVVGAGVAAVALVGMAWHPHLGWILVFAVFGSGPAGAILALAGEVLRPESRSTGFGVYYTFYYVALAGFPAVAGLLRDATGSATGPLLFAALLMGSTVAFLGLLRFLQWYKGALP